MANQTIKLKKYSDVIYELTAHEAITPVMLLWGTTSGLTEPHPVAGGNVLPAFALEDELQGKGIDDDYAEGDKVQIWVPGRGDIVNALLADDQDVVPGNWMESDGEGRLRIHEPDPGDSTTGTVVNPIVGVARETVSSGLGSGSESSAEGLYHNPRVKVTIY